MKRSTLKVQQQTNSPIQDGKRATNKARKMAAAVAAIAPAIPLRFKPYSTLRLLSLYSKNPITPRLFPPLPRRHFPFHSTIPPKRCFFSAISAALKPGERTKTEFQQKKVGEFRKKFKVADIKGAPDEGLDRVGQTLVVMGWVRTLRVQSSVTFLEVKMASFFSFSFYTLLFFFKLI